jgi:aminoglycoside 6'-N-acetyltransferase
MLDTPTLHGERVTLRPVGAEDADRFLEILREPKVERWWGVHDAERVRDDLIENSDDVVFAIEVDGDVIGAVQYSEELTPDYRHAGMDIFLTTSRHGQGLGSEALRVLARYLFDERGHHRLTIDPAVDNVRAIRAYERSDGLLMDLLAREFRSD